jgi:retinol dehydrogenase 12
VRAAGAASGLTVEVEHLPLELEELGSVRACAERFLTLGRPLHVLINNAGLAGSRGLTRDGFERAFGVNHLGHFLLTELLLERLTSSAPSRVVNVASVAHYDATGIDWEALRRPTRSMTGLPEYAVSKLCNVLHASDLAARLSRSGVRVYSLHPGVIASEVWRNIPWGVRHLMKLFMSSNAEGARTLLHCAASATAGRESGLYYDGCQPRAPSALASDAALAALLREKSREWSGLG